MNFKNKYLFKKLLKWNKKKNNSNIPNFAFFKKNKLKHLEISLHHTYRDIECDGLKLIIFYPFTSLKTKKIKILKMKGITGDIIVLHMCTKNHNDMIYGS